MTITIGTTPKALSADPLTGPANFIMVAANGAKKGFSADEKTIEIFAKVVKDLQAVAYLKNLGTIRTYDLSIRTGGATIVNLDGETHTVSLHEGDDQTNLNALRAQLQEKGHVFDCAHSYEDSYKMRRQDIEKQDPPKWKKLWAKRSPENEAKIKALEAERKEYMTNKTNKASLPSFSEEEIDEDEDEIKSVASSASNLNEIRDDNNDDEIFSANSDGAFDLSGQRDKASETEESVDYNDYFDSED